jgi:hypothetical protein
MRFHHEIPVSPTMGCPLNAVDRALRRRDIRTVWSENGVRASLFAWTDLVRTADSERLSWNALHFEVEDSSLHLRFEYNWALQVLAQLTLSAFTLGFMNRFGAPVATQAVVVAMNVAFAGACSIAARGYAKKLASELEATIRN